MGPVGTGIGARPRGGPGGGGGAAPLVPHHGRQQEGEQAHAASVATARAARAGAAHDEPAVLEPAPTVVRGIGGIRVVHPQLGAVVHAPVVGVGVPVVGRAVQIAVDRRSLQVVVARLVHVVHEVVVRVLVQRVDGAVPIAVGHLPARAPGSSYSTTSDYWGNTHGDPPDIGCVEVSGP